MDGFSDFILPLDIIDCSFKKDRVWSCNIKIVINIFIE